MTIDESRKWQRIFQDDRGVGRYIKDLHKGSESVQIHL